VDVSARRYRYVGLERDDETGLYAMGARYYAAWLGRWTSADPLGIGADGPGVYNYTRGSPVVYVDPGGMDDERYSGGAEGAGPGTASDFVPDDEAAKADAVRQYVAGFASRAFDIAADTFSAVKNYDETAYGVFSLSSAATMWVLTEGQDEHSSDVLLGAASGVEREVSRAVDTGLDAWGGDNQALGSVSADVAAIALPWGLSRLARFAGEAGGAARVGPIQGLRPHRKFLPDPTPVAIGDALPLATKHGVPFPEELQVRVVSATLPRNVAAELGNPPEFIGGEATFRSVLEPSDAATEVVIKLPAESLASRAGTVSALAHEAFELAEIKSILESMSSPGQSWLDVPFSADQWRSWTQSRVQHPSYAGSAHEIGWTESNKLIEREFPGLPER
jgi:RHS repeat-associated protein